MKKYVVYAYDCNDEIIGTAYVFAENEDDATDLANELEIVRWNKCVSFMMSKCIC